MESRNCLMVVVESEAEVTTPEAELQAEMSKSWGLSVPSLTAPKNKSAFSSSDD